MALGTVVSIWWGGIGQRSPPWTGTSQTMVSRQIIELCLLETDKLSVTVTEKVRSDREKKRTERNTEKERAHDLD